MNDVPLGQGADMPLAFSIPKLGVYVEKHLVTRAGKHIAFGLNGHWQIREWNDEGFYFGKLLGELESAEDMAAWLNNSLVVEAEVYERSIQAHIEPFTGI